MSKDPMIASRAYLGDGVYVSEERLMIKLTTFAHGRDNVIFLEREVYEALRLWAQTHGFEPEANDHDD